LEVRNTLRLVIICCSLLTHQNKQKFLYNSIERYGVGVVDGEPTDMMKAFVWEPSVVKIHTLRAATEAATLILSIDYVLILPRVRFASSSHYIIF
jgi:chaperonin GroEL (HSP60 family)